MTRKLPFEPPPPEPVSAAEVAGGVAATVALAAVDVATGQLLGALDLLPDPSSDDKPVDIAPLLATISDTAAPARDADGNAACSRCGAYVPYESMALNEHGYFCAPCAAKLTEEALR